MVFVVLDVERFCRLQAVHDGFPCPYDKEPGDDAYRREQSKRIKKSVAFFNDDKQLVAAVLLAELSIPLDAYRQFLHSRDSANFNARADVPSVARGRDITKRQIW